MNIQLIEEARELVNQFLSISPKEYAVGGEIPHNKRLLLAIANSQKHCELILKSELTPNEISHHYRGLLSEISKCELYK